MADTDLPNGYGALNRPPRPIAPPFGMLVNPWPTPSSQPGARLQRAARPAAARRKPIRWRAY